MVEFKRWMLVSGLSLLPFFIGMGASSGQVIGQPQPGATVRAAPGAGQGGGMVTDRELVQWLIVDNEGEIALSRLAQQQAESKDVKEFAQQMIEEHQSFIEKLQELAPRGQRRPAAAGGADRQRQPQGGREEAARNEAIQPRGRDEVAQIERSDRDPQSAGRQAAGQAGRRQGAVDLVTLKQKLGEQCVQSTKKMLQKKQGQEFDTVFMGVQLFLHQQMLDTLQVFQQHAQSPELQQVLQQGAKTAEHHHDEALKIMQQLEGGSRQAPRTATKPQRESERE